MSPLQLTRLDRLMRRTTGDPSVKIGLADGPVDTTHPALQHASIKHLSSPVAHNRDSPRGAMALLHGTFMAGCLVAERGGAAPGISPSCSLLVRPVFGDAARASTTPECSAYEAAHAIVDLIAAGASVINLSIGLAEDTGRPGKALEEALDFAVERNVPVVVAAGNHGCLGGCGITRHPWAIPVVAADRYGRPMPSSNLSHGVARFGVMAPGEAITSTVPGASYLAMNGSSVATTFVTGAVALLRTLHAEMSAGAIRRAVTCSSMAARTGLAPRLLDAAAASTELQRNPIQNACRLLLQPVAAGGA